MSPGESGWLLGLSRAYELVNAAAHALYSTGLRRRVRPPVPVVSVGNIAAGGTGKTPLVAAVTAALRELGARPAVLTRGYRRADPRPAIAGTGAELPWERIGDEPALLVRALPGTPIVVDADRARGARTAVQEAGATHLVLDDGFQHWRLARDLDVVVVDAADPLCRRHVRREHPRALRRAGAIVINDTPGGQAEEAAALLARFARGPVLVARLEPTAVRLAGEVRPPSWLAGRRVAAAAGIASPDRFAATLTALGADVVGTSAFPDHHAFRRAELEALLHGAHRHEAVLVVTTKDAVKLPADLLAEVAVLETRMTAAGGSFTALLDLLPRSGGSCDKSAAAESG